MANNVDFIKNLKLAKKGNSEAQYYLGVCYDNGQGVEQDYKEAVKWYRKAAEQGHSDAQNNLGVCYYNGQGVEQDYKEAVKWYRKAAEQGHSLAQYNLGVCYDNGQGVEQDYKEAVKWYRKAAEQGYSLAQHNLGVCYYNGKGVEQDYKEAAGWYRKAAMQGNASAEYKLGNCYKLGLGVKQNDREATRWHNRAFKHGFQMENEVAENNVAQKKESPKKEKKELGTMLEIKNSKNQNLDASPGVKYYKGIGVEQDYERAIKELIDEAMNGLCESKHYLAESYRHGNGVEVNFPEAVSWYVQAAMEGFADSQCALGSIYARGEGVNQNYIEALKWYRKAAEQGHDEAKNRVIALEKEYATKKKAKSKLDEYLEELNQLIGMKEVKTSVREIINLLQINERRKENGLPVIPMSHHLVFTGNPGTGKTTVARIIASIYRELGLLEKGHLIEVDRSKIVAGYVGQTALKTQEVISEALGGVLFIDEAYSLAHGDDDNDFGRESIDTLVKAMEDFREQFIVIVAGYEKPMIDFINMNPGLCSRFNKYIKFPDYSPNDLTRIYIQLCEKSQYKLDVSAKKSIHNYFVAISNDKTENFGNARVVRNLFEKTVVNVANRLAGLGEVSLEELVTIKKDDIPLRG